MVSATASYMMTLITFDAVKNMVIWSGIVQGFGFGFVFVPISSICFATIKPDLRAQASSVYSLIRNIGGSVGISSIVFLITYYTKFNHAMMSKFIISGSKNMQAYLQYLPMQDMLARTIYIDMEVTKQAALISYINAFKICMLLNIAVIPLVFLLRSSKIDMLEMCEV